MERWTLTQIAKIAEGPWTKEEDKRLITVLKEHGTKSWSRVALVFNSPVAEVGRTKKQCREHWENELSTFNTRISKTEELHLLCFWQQKGDKWGEIGQLMRKSSTWIRSTWKQVLEREGIEENIELRNRVSLLVRSLEKKINAEDLQPPSNSVEEEIKESANAKGQASGVYEETKEKVKEELVDELAINESACAQYDLSERKGHEIKAAQFNRKPHSKKEIMCAKLCVEVYNCYNKTNVYALTMSNYTM
eukprot:TRINITY_DN6779_c0_g2_i2.p1 TRINITY_DN6779_c0_g2~~TRINITY_DN6779_c0_g2_i2.p1  ORF type:complete len:249 (+),score=47.18 TRINITY_DN6779_c0_g2_i2:156-902(+)